MTEQVEAGPGILFQFAGLAFLQSDPAQLQLSFEECLQIDPSLAAIKDGLGSHEEIEKEYVRLFLSPAGAPCPPWQSANTGDARLLGPSHSSAQAWFQSAGLELNTGHQPADHIGYLLLFYGHLLDSGTPAGKLSSYAAGHLAWIPAFCTHVETESTHRWFKGIAAWTRTLVEQALDKAVTEP